MIDGRASALVAECRELSDSCKYTAAALYIWLRSQRRIERGLLILPIVLGAAATWSAIDASVPYAKWITGACALGAGLIPAIYKALKLDAHVGSVASAAAEYTSLRDRLRQLERIGPTMQSEEFHREFDRLMARLEQVRTLGFAPPERFFIAARKKIREGHYDYDPNEQAQKK